MRYKLRYEIDYSGMDQQQIRDAKINGVLSDREMMELEIDTKIKLPLPEKGDRVEINSHNYIIQNKSFKMESDCYTIIYLVKSSKQVLKEAEEKRERERQMYKAIARI